MGAGTKLLIFLWFIIITDGVGAAVAARQSFRISRDARNETAYQWFIAFGLGLSLYAIANFWTVWNGVVNGPVPPVVYSTSYIIQAFAARGLQTIGVWTIALTLMNGNTPGMLRHILFWIFDAAKWAQSKFTWKQPKG